MRLVTLSHVTVGYDGPAALRDVDLILNRGEIVTIVGPNGSGKSTLVRALIGALSPRSGHITRAPGLRIGYVPQRLALDATLPIRVGRFLNLPNRHAPAAIAAALDEVGVEDALRDRPLSALSGGQFQRVLLARALLDKPDLLILDEPTSALDQPGAAAFYQLIARVRDRENCGILLVSHDLHVVMSESDRVICLNGHVCCVGTPAVVASAPEYRALFGDGTKGALALYRHHHDHDHDDGACAS